MRIGIVETRGNLYLAPMAAYTSWPFRRICRRMGASLVTTEVAKGSEIARGTPSTMQILAFEPDEHPIAGQILASEPEHAGVAAAILAQMGFDIVDLNCGCPKRRVLSDGMGGMLMGSPETTERIVARMVQSVRIPVTVKIRAGLDQGTVTAVETAKRCEGAGAAAVCVHPRWARRAASLAPDWDIIAQVKQAVRIPVIGNGAVHNANDVAKMIAQTGCDGVAIGQAAVGRPWIFRQAAALLETGVAGADPSQEEILGVLLEHYRGLVAHHGERRGTIMMRKQSCHYAKHLHNGKAFNAAAAQASTTEQFMAAVDAWLVPHPRTRTSQP